MTKYQLIKRLWTLSLQGDNNRIGEWSSHENGEIQGKKDILWLTNDVLIYEHKYTYVLCQILRISVVFMHVTRHFTLFLALGLFVVVSGVFGGIKFKFHVFEALARISKLFPKTSHYWKPLFNSKDSRTWGITLIWPHAPPFQSNEALYTKAELQLLLE